MKPAGAFTIPADHPALPGHFPGRPVVPGVVLLDHVVDAVLATAPGRRAAGLPLVKFTHPVRPGERVEVACATPDHGPVAFACRVGDTEVARGTVLIDRGP